MKKIIVIMLVCLLFMTACGKTTSTQYISRKLNLTIANARELENKDTHGGFHGDGVTYIALQISDGQVLGQIKEEEQWKAFPLDKTVQILAYGYSDDKVELGPYLTDEEGNVLLPEIKNGYYRLIDRHEEKDIPILERYSFNFTLAIYDSDTNILYFCEMDT